MLFLRPTGPDSAKIAVAFRKHLPHRDVKAAIDKLMTASGWKLGNDLSIDETTVHPEDPKRFPPTTGAMFSVQQASLLHDNAPVLRPFLVAFQNWNRIEILLESAEIEPYNGITTFHTPALDLQLLRGEGVYSYIINIRDHTGELPALKQTEPLPTPPTSVPVAQRPLTSSQLGEDKPSRTSLFWPYLFIAVGAGLTGGTAAYLLLRKSSVPSRPRLR